MSKINYQISAWSNS